MQAKRAMAALVQFRHKHVHKHKHKQLHMHKRCPVGQCEEASKRKKHERYIVNMKYVVEPGENSETKKKLKEKKMVQTHIFQ